MATTVNQYKIYCITEDVYVEGWGETEPTVCYNNNTHTVNSNSVQLIQTISTEIMKIKEDSIDIPRNVWIKDIVFTNIPSNTTQEQSYTFPFPVSMYSFTFSTDDTNRGDQISIANNPDTNLGLITQNITAGDTTIYPPAAFFSFGWHGFYIKVTDGTNLDDLGYVESLDPVNGSIVVSEPAVNNYSSTNTVFTMTLFTMKDLMLGAPGVFKYGEDVIGGATVPAGTVTKIIYKNNTIPGDLTDSPKKFVFYLTLLY